VAPSAAESVAGAVGADVLPSVESFRHLQSEVATLHAQLEATNAHAQETINAMYANIQEKDTYIDAFNAEYQRVLAEYNNLQHHYTQMQQQMQTQPPQEQQEQPQVVVGGEQQQQASADESHHGEAQAQAEATGAPAPSSEAMHSPHDDGSIPPPPPSNLRVDTGGNDASSSAPVPLPAIPSPPMPASSPAPQISIDDQAALGAPVPDAHLTLVSPERGLEALPQALPSVASSSTTDPAADAALEQHTLEIERLHKTIHELKGELSEAQRAQMAFQHAERTLQDRLDAALRESEQRKASLDALTPASSASSTGPGSLVATATAAVHALSGELKSVRAGVDEREHYITLLLERMSLGKDELAKLKEEHAKLKAEKEKADKERAEKEAKKMFGLFKGKKIPERDENEGKNWDGTKWVDAEEEGAMPALPPIPPRPRPLAASHVDPTQIIASLAMPGSSRSAPPEANGDALSSTQQQPSFMFSPASSVHSLNSSGPLMPSMPGMLLPSAPRPANAYGAAVLRPKYANAFEDMGFAGDASDGSVSSSAAVSQPASMPSTPAHMLMPLPGGGLSSTGKIFVPSSHASVSSTPTNAVAASTPAAGAAVPTLPDHSSSLSRRGSQSSTVSSLAPSFPSQNSPISPLDGAESAAATPASSELAVPGAGSSSTGAPLSARAARDSTNFTFTPLPTNGAAVAGGAAGLSSPLVGSATSSPSVSSVGGAALLSEDQLSLLQGRSVREVLAKLEESERLYAGVRSELEALRQRIHPEQSIPPHARRASIDGGAHTGSQTSSLNNTPSASPRLQALSVPSPASAGSVQPPVDYQTYNALRQKLHETEMELRRVQDELALQHAQLLDTQAQLAQATAAAAAASATAATAREESADPSAAGEDDSSTLNLADADEGQLLTVIRKLRSDKVKLTKQFNVQRAQLQRLELANATSPARDVLALGALPSAGSPAAAAAGGDPRQLAEDLARVKADALRTNMERQIKEQQFIETTEQLRANLRASEAERNELAEQVRTLQAHVIDLQQQQQSSSGAAADGDTVPAGGVGATPQKPRQLRAPFPTPGAEHKQLVPVPQSLLSPHAHNDDEDEGTTRGGSAEQQRELRALAQQLTAALAQLQATNAQLERQEAQLAAAAAAAAQASARSTPRLRGDVNVFFSCSRYAGLSVAFVFLAIFFASIHLPPMLP
jgi:hypothetical protein